MIKIGGILQINGGKEIAGVDSALGQIVDIQTPGVETYTPYPLWIKILSGEQKGSIHGFNYDEIKTAEYLNQVISLAAAN